MNLLLAAEYYYANPDFVRLGSELVRRNHNVTVATSLRAFDRTPKRNPVEICEIKPFVTIYRLPHLLSFPLLQLGKLVKSKKIDIIHAVNDHSTNVAVASLVSEATGIPLVYTIQGPGTRTGHPLVDTVVATYDLTVERWIAKQAGKVILLSSSLNSTAEKLRVNDSKVTVIPSGIDSVHFDRDRPEVKERAMQLRNELDINGKVVVGFAGRLVPAKGLTYLFSAIKQIEKKHPNIVLLIVGEGAQRGELETLASQLRIRTVFAGWQADMLPFYALMDIFVLPSLFEGLSNVILEAMAMKTAIVATNVGGTPDVLSNGENGFLVPAKNVSRLASALKTLVRDEALRTETGVKNRLKVEREFQWSRAVEKVEKVYSDVTG
jgi:glycosyltransferase involved in cell wall biosynthesis